MNRRWQLQSRFRLVLARRRPLSDPPTGSRLAARHPRRLHHRQRIAPICLTPFTPWATGSALPLSARFIDQAFPSADTSDFAGSVRCDAVGEGLFSAVALEMDPGNRIFTTLPVVAVAEMSSQE